MEEFEGVTASRGKVVGRACLDLKDFRDGDVIIAETTYAPLVPLMKRASAIVTSTGGVLSHAAVVSRELGLPCVVRAEGVLSVPHGALVEVDATGPRGRVRVIEAP